MTALLLLALPFLADGMSIVNKNYVENVGGKMTINCEYDSSYKEYVKYWCKGYYRSSCEILRQTLQSTNDDNNLMLEDKGTGGMLTVTMSNLKKEDTGWYWCGIERPLLLDIMDYTHIEVDENPGAGKNGHGGGTQTPIYYILIPLLCLAVLILVVAVTVGRNLRRKNTIGKSPKNHGKCPDVVVTPPSDNDSSITYADIVLPSQEKPTHLKNEEVQGWANAGSSSEYSEIVFRK
ncbi:transmembrane domain-containing protein TMIGD3-like isoform X2 [Ambystoma mexicanum]|uniref:transmembrane domain-containing protein TMIGD3-like isoform X2 n=1 Tax=Ambystoma mexicanum TaxID=8296 RepID=UPI0037E8F7F8